MHFSSVSACEPSSIATVAATNSSSVNVRLYLPALSNFVSLKDGPNNLPLGSTSNPLIVGVGSTIYIEIQASATALDTKFYQYAVEEISTSNRYAGYFSVTTKTTIPSSLQVLSEERTKKWYNHSATKHDIVFYDGKTTSSVSGGFSNIPSVMPVHVVPDPATEATYIYSSINGAILSRYPVVSAGSKPFSYKKVANSSLYSFVDITGITGNISGTAAKTSFTPIVGNSSARFNGANSYLATNKSALNFSSDDWSIEFWAHPRRFPAVDLETWAVDSSRLSMFLSNSNGFGFGFGLTKIFLVINNTIVCNVIHGIFLNSWYYITVTRKNNSVMIFINGAQITAGYFARPVDGGTNSKTWVGTYLNTGSFYNGYISNLTILKGFARNYTKYTVPTAAYTNTAYTQFSLGLDSPVSPAYTDPLLGISNTVASANFKNLSVVKEVSVLTDYQPFSPTVTNGGSIRFQSNSYVYSNIDSNSTYNLNSGSGFTIEFWVYPEQIAGTSFIRTISAIVNTADDLKGRWSVGIYDKVGSNWRGVFLAFASSTGARDSGEAWPRYYHSITNASGNSGTQPGQIQYNKWTHVAITSNGTDLSFFVDGTRTNYISSANFNCGTVDITKEKFYLGNSTLRGTDYEYNGYLSNFRIVSSQVYSGTSLTLPTAPFSSIANTNFLLKVQSAMLIDKASKHTITGTGVITLATDANTKFNTVGLALNNSGFFVTNTASPTIKSIFNSGNVAIEWWLYQTAGSLPSFGFYLDNDLAATNFIFSLDSTIDPANYAVLSRYTVTNNVKLSSSTASTLYNSWHHYAVTKRGSFFNFYLDGVLQFSGEYTAVFSSNMTKFYIGGDGLTSGLSGYMDGFVVSSATLAETTSFTNPTALELTTYSILATNFNNYNLVEQPSGAAIENFVYLLTTNGYVTKIQLTTATAASPNIPANSSSERRSNWFLSSGLSYEEDIPFIGSFITGSLIRRAKALAPGITCVDYYDGLVYVGATNGVWILDGDELDIIANPALPFTPVSIKAFSYGGSVNFIVTTIDNKVYYISSFTPLVYLIVHTATVLGIPDSYGDYLYIPVSEASKLIVINLRINPTVIEREVEMNKDFAPSYVAADASTGLIYVCGHDSDIVYYNSGSGSFTPIQFDNKVAWVSASTGTLIASYYLIEETILDLPNSQRSAAVTLPSRGGPVDSAVGTKPFKVKMLYRHNNVKLTVPTYSNSTLYSIAGSASSWITNFQNSKIYAWGNGVKGQFSVGHNDYVSVTYRSSDAAAISIRIPAVIGDRHTVFDVNLVTSVAYPKNIFSTKLPNVTAYSVDVNTSMLLHFNEILSSSLFVDEVDSTVYVGSGLVAISNLAAKFDGLSVKFSGGVIAVPATAKFGFGLGDFTVELWIKVSGGGKKLIVPTATSLGTWALYINSSGSVVWHNGVSTLSTGLTTVVNNAWRHIAVVRSSNNIRLYIDGVVAISSDDFISYSPAGTVDYNIGNGSYTVSGLTNFDGYIDELRVSNIGRYTATFAPGVPGYVLTTPVKNVDAITYLAQFEAVMYNLGAFTPVAALEYGTLYVNGLVYDGTRPINSDDRVSVDIIFNSTHNAIAPVLTIGKKEYALPVNTVIQELADNTIELAGQQVSDSVDYTGEVVIAATGEYYFPNYSTNYVTSVKKDTTPLVPGEYVNLTQGDIINVYGLRTSARMNDTTDVFLIGPRNYQISVETVKTAVPKFMDFGTLITKDLYSTNGLIDYGYTTVGSITDPFVRFEYKSQPVTVTGIPLDPGTMASVEITLTTNQAYAGAYLIRTTVGNVVTKGTVINNVINGDKIQIVKKVLNYFETAIMLQVSYVDSDTGITDAVDVGKWKISQPTILGSNKEYSQITNNNTNLFDVNQEIGHTADSSYVWDAIYPETVDFMYSDSINELPFYTWSARIVGINTVDIPYNWGQQLHDNANYATSPYTWGSPTHNNSNYATSPYTWGFFDRTSEKYAASPYSWSSDSFTPSKAVSIMFTWDKDVFNSMIPTNSSINSWAVFTAGIYYNLEAIVEFYNLRNLVKATNFSTIRNPAFESYSVVASNYDIIAKSIKADTYGLYNVNDFNFFPYSVNPTNSVPPTTFKPDTKALTAVPDTKFLTHGTHGFFQYTGLFTQPAPALATAIPPKFLNSRTVIGVASSAPSYQATRMYGRDIITAKFLPTHTYISNSNTETFLLARTIAQTNHRTPNFLPSHNYANDAITSSFSSNEVGTSPMRLPDWRPFRAHENENMRIPVRKEELPPTIDSSVADKHFDTAATPSYLLKIIKQSTNNKLVDNAVSFYLNSLTESVLVNQATPTSIISHTLAVRDAIYTNTARTLSTILFNSAAFETHDPIIISPTYSQYSRTIEKVSLLSALTSSTAVIGGDISPDLTGRTNISLALDVDVMSRQMITLPLVPELVTRNLLYIDFSYQRDLATKLLFNATYSLDQRTEMLITPEYQTQRRTSAFVNVAYIQDFYSQLLIAANYNKFDITKILITPEYRVVQPTEIYISPSYWQDRRTMSLITPLYDKNYQTEILIGFVPLKDIATLITQTINYVIDSDIAWDDNTNYSQFGAFSTSGAATADATARGYSSFSVKQLTSRTGAIYYTYRVDQSNNFVCGLSAPKVPAYGLIQGG